MNYKIINKKTKSFIYLNKEQKELFFTKNAFQDSKGVIKYNIINLTELRANKIFNFIMYAITFLAFLTATFIICYTFTLIEFITL